MRYFQKFAAHAAVFSLIAAAGALISATTIYAASEPGLDGHWSGGGKVRFPSGATENARCRANFRQRGGGVHMVAVCATSSARIEQTAELSRVGAGRFAGEFENSEYSISGSIRITTNGQTLHAVLNGGGGSADIHLSR